jgi:hypothetical protein
MHVTRWAVIGGVLLVIGVGWSLYYTYVLYPTATNCPPGALCASLLPLWDQPGLWLGIFVAIVGSLVLVVTIAWWLTHPGFNQRQSKTRS